MSPRAAWRLESLGFREVYDYVEGKHDWLAAGLPYEGESARRPDAGAVCRKDVPTSGPEERIEDVRERVAAAGWDACVVVNEERVVFGLLRSRELRSGHGEKVAQVMRPGPSTFRPHVGIEEMAAHMVQHDLASSPITTSDGRLVGLLVREDALREAHRLHARHEGDE